MGAQSGKCGLRGVLHGRLDHAVQAAEHTVHVQLRASCDRRHEPTHHGQRGAAGLTAGSQTIAQTPTQAIQEGLAEGGGALLGGWSALEGEGGATAGQTTREQLLEDKIFMHDVHSVPLHLCLQSAAT